MANEPTITIVGNLTGDPTVNYTGSGIPVASFTVAHNTREKDPNGNFVDGAPIFVRCSVWREHGENVAASLTKGTRVIVHGRLKVSKWEKDGVERQSLEMDVDEIGPSLRWARATVSRSDSGYQQKAGNVTYTAPQGGTTGDQWTQTSFMDEAPF